MGEAEGVARQPGNGWKIQQVNNGQSRPEGSLRECYAEAGTTNTRCRSLYGSDEVPRIRLRVAQSAGCLRRYTHQLASYRCPELAFGSTHLSRGAVGCLSEATHSPKPLAPLLICMEFSRLSMRDEM